MFENLIKIIRSKGDAEENNNEIELPAFSDNFISIKAVTSENLKDFLDALSSFIDRLNELVADLYKSEKNIYLCKEYEKAISELSRKEAQIKYLSSYSESMQSKIEAFQKQLDEKEATINRLEDKKSVVLNKLINLKKNMRRNQSKPISRIPIPMKSRLQLRERQQTDNVTLNLLPIASVSSNEIDDENDNFSDWMELE
ncbi:unnamed protein product [Chironomus riparius]|uniref:Uncharacterized protein n=1 Tax=Chironomus riparius TaxID=315576 RepID=A0A9N9RPE2_9DIPT|nr:unnamed protein product [Chironomus riparius]